MIELSSYFVFLAASVALILVPGPAQALVIATSLDGGPVHGALTAVGLNIGTLIHAAAAALGLSAILASIAGSLWSILGASSTFIAGASFAALAAMGLLLYRPTTQGAAHGAGT